MIIDVEDPEAFIAHYGVKGMKWGVRRERRTRRLSDAGIKGNKAAKARVLLTRRGTARVGPIDLVRGRGVQGGARRKVSRIQDRDRRRKLGQGTIEDAIRHYGSTRPSDFIPVRTKNASPDKRNILDNHKVMLATAGALFMAQQLGKQVAKD